MDSVGEHIIQRDIEGKQSDRHDKLELLDAVGNHSHGEIRRLLVLEANI